MPVFEKAQTTAMRYHDVALKRWLHSNFYVRDGYSVPVVFARAMDAYGQFQKLWSQDNNPFAYLLAAKDSNGTPLYLPHPEPPAYPLFAVERKNFRLRVEQNYGHKKFRRLDWRTVADVTHDGLTKEDLKYVTQARMPMAVDFNYQVDFLCLRADTFAALWLEPLFEKMRRGGAMFQTWIALPVPCFGTKLVRAYIDGEIEDLTPPQPDDGNMVIFRGSMNLIVEGWVYDQRLYEVDTVWRAIFRATNPTELDPSVYEEVFTQGYNLRTTPNANQVLEARSNVPAASTS